MSFKDKMEHVGSILSLWKDSLPDLSNCHNEHCKEDGTSMNAWKKPLTPITPSMDPTSHPELELDKSSDKEESITRNTTTFPLQSFPLIPPKLEEHSVPPVSSIFLTSFQPQALIPIPGIPHIQPIINACCPIPNSTRGSYSYSPNPSHSLPFSNMSRNILIHTIKVKSKPKARLINNRWLPMLLLLWMSLFLPQILSFGESIRRTEWGSFQKNKLSSTTQGKALGYNNTSTQYREEHLYSSALHYIHEGLEKLRLLHHCMPRNVGSLCQWKHHAVFSFCATTESNLLRYSLPLAKDARKPPA